ncbi:hypothetical protein ACHAW5_009230 [Stephanodiscus triporus]|uniref:Serine aminopeptidase S33 domain-containing protein n=1 Tax=Stephanodiscus triporus TaxID=2934178 RepID=A0ABD3QIF5_9STRA
MSLGTELDKFGYKFSTSSLQVLYKFRVEGGGDDETTKMMTDDFPVRPRVDGFTILSFGILAYALSLIWPPLLLVVSCALAMIVPYSFRENDDAESRRRMWTEFMKNRRDDDGLLLPDGLLGRDDHDYDDADDGIDVTEGYWTNRRGMALMTSIMAPRRRRRRNGDDDGDADARDVDDVGDDVRAVVCLCHGYMDNVSFLKRIQFRRFVREGIAVVAIEYEGHGRSDGPNALVPKWEDLVTDAHEYFVHATTTRFPNVSRRFLMGESMGGAVAYDIINDHPDTYDGVIFAAPMVKILVTPPSWVVDVFERVVGRPGTINVLSRMPWAPSPGDVPHLSFKDKDKMRLALSVPTRYGRKPRLATARELLNATRRISSTISRFDAPFIVLHGLEDRITDPKMSEMLYNESPSIDKEIRLYRGMYHNLTTGETDENIDVSRPSGGTRPEVASTAVLRT